MQLVAYGMQDVYLTGNSQITFFKNLYRRHTNFSVEAVEQTFQSSSRQLGNRLVAVISRNGDLLHRLWLEVEMPTDLPLDTDEIYDLTNSTTHPGDTATSISHKKYRYVSKLGNTLMKSAEVEIGGQRIDKVYGRWEELWQGYSKRQEKKACFDHMTANFGDNLFGLGANNAKATSTNIATAVSYPPVTERDVSLCGTGRGGETPKAHYPIVPENNNDLTKQQNQEAQRLAGGKFKMYLPINFWFSKGSAGAALPLIALQYHEVRVTIEFAKASEILIKHCITSTPPSPNEAGAGNAPGSYNKANNNANKYESASDSEIANFQMSSNPKLYSDFFYLDTDERRRFSQMSHEYLIEQLQFTGKESLTVKNDADTNHSLRLNFNHPTKAIYFTAEPASIDSSSGLLPNPFYNGHCHPIQVLNAEKEFDSSARPLAHIAPHDNSPCKEVGLMLNGHDRFSQRSGSYFSWVQPYQHHTRCPDTSLRHGSWYGMYSFCLSPEEHQPSGALNFSRIDNAQLKLVFKAADSAFSNDSGSHTRDVYVYALSYNVLRILSGMGGLSFSN